MRDRKVVKPVGRAIIHLAALQVPFCQSDPVEVNVRFTRPEIPGQRTLLGVVYSQQRRDTGVAAEETRDRLARMIHTHLLEQGRNVVPLIDVSVLQAPSGT